MAQHNPRSTDTLPVLSFIRNPHQQCFSPAPARCQPPAVLNLDVCNIVPISSPEPKLSRVLQHPLMAASSRDVCPAQGYPAELIAVSAELFHLEYLI